MLEVALGDGKFYSLYGFIAAVTDKEDNSLTVAYAFHKIEFSLPTENGFKQDEIDAIKNHFCKEKALKSLQQENVIKEISYVR